MKRLSLLIVIVFLALYFSWWVLFLPVVAYIFLYRGYELLVLAALIDSYYGTVAHYPYYTLATLAIMLMMELARPLINFNSKVLS